MDTYWTVLAAQLLRFSQGPAFILLSLLSVSSGQLSQQCSEIPRRQIQCPAHISRAPHDRPGIRWPDLNIYIQYTLYKNPNITLAIDVFFSC